MTSFFDDYLAFNEDTEAPKLYHRWSAIVSVGALLGRSSFIAHGHFRIFPNLYCMLIGDPGVRKSTSIKTAVKLMSAAGYDKFAAEKTSKEKFLVDLEGADGDGETLDTTASLDLFGTTPREAREVLVAADEFNEFVGLNNFEFCTTLGNLWDWDNESKPFESRIKSGRSVAIWQPFVSIMGGTTPEGFATTFPPALLGQGFLSRLILVHGVKTGRRIAFPTPPTADATAKIVGAMQEIQHLSMGSATLEASAKQLLVDIYERWVELDDVRFKSYSNRRFTQLLKVVLIHTAARRKTSITDEDVISANTVLAATEALMPKAMGEFGKSKNSDVANKIMQILDGARAPVSISELWAKVHKDLAKLQELTDIMQGLRVAEKVQTITIGTRSGFLSQRKAAEKPVHVDWSLLTKEEREGLS